MAIVTGTEVGALLVDGLGDGLLIECPGEDVGQLRLMSFGLLQVCCCCCAMLQNPANARESSDPAGQWLASRSSSQALSWRT